MKKNKIVPWFFAVAGIIVCTNIILLIFNEDSIFERKAYVGEWSSISRLDLKETAMAEGVYKPAEESTVFLDPSQGTYVQTMVEKGQEVQEGDPLIEYQAHNYEETQRELELQLSEVTAEINAVESTLSQLADMPFSEDELPNSSFTPEEDSSEDSSDSETSSYLKEQFRLEMEQELTRLRAKRGAIESQLTGLETEGQSLSIPSPVSGIVKEISNQEGGPVIVISSSELVISGLLSEEDRKKIEPGMDVKISGVQTDGKISELADYPEVPDPDADSNYTFQVKLDEEPEDILPGYHTYLEIILAQSLHTPAVHKNQLTATVIPAVWIMKEDGRIYNQEIETGLEMNNWIEVVEGAEAGQAVVESPERRLATGADFVTPLETRFLDWDQLKAADPAFFREYPLLAGLLHR